MMRTGAPLAKADMAPRVPTANPDIGAAGDHRLQGLARARGVEDLELDAVLLEDAGLVAEMGDRGVPIAALADGELELVGRNAGGDAVSTPPPR